MVLPTGPVPLTRGGVVPEHCSDYGQHPVIDSQARSYAPGRRWNRPMPSRGEGALLPRGFCDLRVSKAAPIVSVL